MGEDEKKDVPATPTPDDIATAAANIGADGISSYSHGSRQVSRSNPRQMLELADDLELRKRRRRYGIFLYCNQGDA